MLRQSRYVFAILSAIAGFVFLTLGCQSTGLERPPDEVTVQLSWTHWAGFSGFYAADQSGYYTAEGLDVKFMPGGPGTDPLISVLDGSAQVGVIDAAELITARADGKQLRAIAAINQRSPLVFITLPDSDITGPKDFAGKTIRVAFGMSPTLQAMTGRFGVGPDQYTQVRIPSDLAKFSSGDPPIWGAYITGFATDLQLAGQEFQSIFPDDYGVHFYGNTIFTTDDLIADNPELVSRFLRATLKGYADAVENPSKTGTLVTVYKPDADPALESAKMVASVPLVHTGQDHIGWMKPEVWAGMEHTLRQQGVLNGTVELHKVYTMEFLQQIYNEGGI